MPTRLLICGLATLLISVQLVPMAAAQDEPDAELNQFVVQLLREKDKEMRSLGLEQVRSKVKGTAATKQFAEVLPSLSPEAQVGLLSALRDRGDSVARPAVLDLLHMTDSEEVQAAAISALGSLGEVADLALLAKHLDQGSDKIKAAARGALVRLPGQSISPAITAKMKRAAPNLRIALIEILTTRRAIESIPEIQAAATDNDAAVRTAAMKALGRIAGPEHVEAMVQGVLRAESRGERAEAEKNVMFVCNRIEDPDQRARPLLEAMTKLSRADQLTMLSTLGRVGGPDALKKVEAAVKDRDSRTHAIGIRAICNWPDASVAPRLIQLVKTDAHPSHRTTALRALIRVAPLPDGRTDAEKLDLLKKAMKMCQRDAERSLALERARAIRLPETLRFVLPYTDQPAFAETACETIVELAHHRSLREPNEAEFHPALDKVIATSKNPTNIDRAQRYKKDQTWVRPK